MPCRFKYAFHMYFIARTLQLIGLMLVPIAIAGNLAEIAGVGTKLTLMQSLLLSGIGIALFYFGKSIQPKKSL